MVGGEGDPCCVNVLGLQAAAGVCEHRLRATRMTTNFLSGFCDEVCARLCSPMAKEADMDASPGLLKKLESLGLGSLKSPAKRIAVGAGGIGLFHKLVDPDVGIGRAVAGGAALTGGGMLGARIGRKLKMGGRGRTALSLLGSVVAGRAVRNRDKAKHRRRSQARREARK